MMDAGIVGYTRFSAYNAVPYPYPGLPENIAGLAGSATLTNANEGELASVLTKIKQAMVAEFGATAGTIVVIEEVRNYDNFYAWFQKHYDSGRAGGSALLKSRLLDESVFTGEVVDSVDAFLEASKIRRGMSLFNVGGKGVNHAVPRGGSNAVNPGWRKALVHSCE